MNCPICKKLGIQLVPVQFESESIDAQDREKITRGIENAMSDTETKIVVTEADTNGYIHCKAYKDENGHALPVHQGHCTGCFEGSEECRYYVGSLQNSSSVSWCSYKDEADKRKEMEAERRRSAQQHVPCDIPQDLPLPWER